MVRAIFSPSFASSFVNGTSEEKAWRDEERRSLLLPACVGRHKQLATASRLAPS